MQESIIWITRIKSALFYFQMTDKEIPIITKLLLICIILYVETKTFQIFGYNYMMGFFWDAFDAWTLKQPNVNLDAMASVSGSIQDMANPLGRQERDAAVQAHANLLD